MATRAELKSVLARRYRVSSRVEKGRILDEFVAITGFHRKHAMRFLRSDPDGRTAGRRNRPRIYQEAERNALIVLWEAADRVCGKRLKALLPILIESMERHGHIDLAPEIRAKLLSMSAATIDRALRSVREQGGRPRRRSVLCDAASRFVLQRIGEIQRLVSSRPILLLTAVLRLAAVSSIRSFSRTSRPAGRNARHFWCANRGC
jgi:hypothetical protein